MGRAKASTDIWPASHVFWPSPAKPGQILGSPIQSERYNLPSELKNRTIIGGPNRTVPRAENAGLWPARAEK